MKRHARITMDKLKGKPTWNHVFPQTECFPVEVPFKVMWKKIMFFLCSQSDVNVFHPNSRVQGRTSEVNLTRCRGLIFASKIRRGFHHSGATPKSSMLMRFSMINYGQQWIIVGIPHYLATSMWFLLRLSRQSLSWWLGSQYSNVSAKHCSGSGDFVNWEHQVGWVGVSKCCRPRYLGKLNHDLNQRPHHRWWWM